MDLYFFGHGHSESFDKEINGFFSGDAEHFLNQFYYTSEHFYMVCTLLSRLQVGSERVHRGTCKYLGDCTY